MNDVAPSVAAPPSAPSAGEAYAGGAFAEELPNGRATGRLHVDDARVHVRPADASIDDETAARLAVPLAGARLRLGGANDRLVFFEHPAHPDLSLYASGREILRDPRLTANAGLAEQLAGLRGKARRGWYATAAVLAGIALTIALLVQLKDPLIGAVASWVPADWEARLGQASWSQMQLQLDVVDDPAVTRALDRLVDPLLVNLPDDRTTYAFHVIDDPSFNAFALPGGIIAVHTGLIDAAARPEVVQGVMAHEIAHVTERHSLHRVLSSVGLFVIVQAIFGDVSGVVAVVADGGYFLLTQAHSRDQEREADDVGLDYLVAAGIDPSGMVETFTTLSAQLEADGLETYEQATAWFSTHPTTDDRIAHLERRAAALSDGRTWAPQDPALLTDLQTAIRDARGASGDAADDAGAADDRSGGAVEDRSGDDDAFDAIEGIGGR
ncbi:MAG: M48 family metallopeptidase [Acidobacteriota bacterium]